jgi:hypothetical protein
MPEEKGHDEERCAGHQTEDASWRLLMKCENRERLKVSCRVMDVSSLGTWVFVTA